MTSQYCEKLMPVVDWGLFCKVEQQLPIQQTKGTKHKNKQVN
jgi:hypothetical protein